MLIKHFYSLNFKKSPGPDRLQTNLPDGQKCKYSQEIFQQIQEYIKKVIHNINKISLKG